MSDVRLSSSSQFCTFKPQMKIRTQLTKLLLLCTTSACFASGGTDEYELPWSHKNEVLMYHSCGCADSCWVAEVRERKTKNVLNRLSCDCTSLSYSKDGRERDTPIHESCEAMNESTNKAGLIKSKIEQLRMRTAKKRR